MGTRLCFVYGTMLDPALLERAAPGAGFDRIAHLPDYRLAFSPSGTPVIVADTEATVWGSIFIVPADEVARLGETAGFNAEASTARAVDRDGNRHSVAVFSGPDGGQPDPRTIETMVRGARHWGLPAGWILGLEDLVDPLGL